MDIFSRFRQNTVASQKADGLPLVPPMGAFAELAALFGVIHLIDWMTPDIDVINLDPSPMWLPILLLSLQYGTVAGLLAAGAATASYVMNGLPEQIIDEHHFAYLLRVWALPILWIGVALVLGQFRLRQIELKQRLVASLDERTREADALTAYSADLERRCRELERMLSSRQERDGGAVLRTVAELGKPGEDLRGAFTSLCGVAFPGAGLNVYEARPEGFELVLTAGAAVPAARNLAKGHPIVTALTSGRTGLSVLRQEQEVLLAGAALAAAPIADEQQGRLIGIITLTRMDSSVLKTNVAEDLAAMGRLLAPLMADGPGGLRIVVDNTGLDARSGGAAVNAKRRHFSWQQATASGSPRQKT